MCIGDGVVLIQDSESPLGTEPKWECGPDIDMADINYLE